MRLRYIVYVMVVGTMGCGCGWGVLYVVVCGWQWVQDVLLDLGVGGLGIMIAPRESRYSRE